MEYHLIAAKRVYTTTFLNDLNTKYENMIEISKP